MAARPSMFASFIPDLLDQLGSARISRMFIVCVRGHHIIEFGIDPIDAGPARSSVRAGAAGTPAKLMGGLWTSAPFGRWRERRFLQPARGSRSPTPIAPDRFDSRRHADSPTLR